MVQYVQHFMFKICNFLVSEEQSLRTKKLKKIILRFLGYA